ncbi:glycosyltransferase family 2 protein, partial [Streptomyces sp. URMC 127]|uniref:glycosyltransferase family 2 protein n=1 Tax=Streptomyces sp. URMC 127 TaxID=3423402 RepID=UPI003F1E32A7
MTLRHARTGVAVITRNRRESLLRSLGHLLDLPEQPPIVVVDNASTDGTARAVRSLASRCPQVTLHALDRNLGATGRNLAAAALPTPYVAFADDDSWWEPGALATAAALFDAHPRLALIAAEVQDGVEAARAEEGAAPYDGRAG